MKHTKNPAAAKSFQIKYYTLLKLHDITVTKFYTIFGSIKNLKSKNEHTNNLQRQIKTSDSERQHLNTGNLKNAACRRAAAF